MNSITGKSLNSYTQNTAFAGYGEGITRTLRGINHRHTGEFVPPNKDHQGFVFFTRPQLNLSRGNLGNVRTFMELATDIPNSFERYIRCMLDPRVAVKTPYGAAEKCDLIRNKNAFITVLTNRIKTLSGIPDIQTQSHVTKQGLMGEEWGAVDSAPNNLGSYTVSASFKDFYGNAIFKLMRYWVLYPAYVKINQMVKYPDYILSNRLDYNTRIYRLKMDTQCVKVTGIWCCGAAYPETVPSGNFYDFNKEAAYEDVEQDQSYSFKCFGSFSDEAILMDEFNKAGICFNSSMHPRVLAQGPSVSKLVKIPPQYLNLFNNDGYPRINLFTRELEWYIEIETYQALVGGL